MFHFIKSLRLLILSVSWATLARAACDSRKYETIIGGYQNANGVDTIGFAIDASSSDMVVYGKGYYTVYPFGYIYFLEEASCEILWLIPFYQIEKGVTFATFDPHKSSRIVGIAESASNGNRLFYIEKYKAIWYDGYQLTHKTPILSNQLLSFHLGD